jgi:hypothetical protein
VLSPVELLKDMLLFFRIESGASIADVHPDFTLGYTGG